MRKSKKIWKLSKKLPTDQFAAAETSYDRVKIGVLLPVEFSGYRHRKKNTSSYKTDTHIHTPSTVESLKIAFLYALFYSFKQIK